MSFAEFLGIRKVESVWHYGLRDPTFGRFSRTPTCDRRTKGQTNRHMTLLIPALAIESRG